MWASVADTLRHTVLPKVTDPHARNATIQLIGLALYAGKRSDDPSAQRFDELLAALGPDVTGDVLSACSAVLNDHDHPASDAVRHVLMRHLDEDLAEEAVLLEAFRGRLPDG
jgi:hypothetical protein